MSRTPKWKQQKSPKSEFNALLCGTNKPLLEQWKNDATNGKHRPPWAPKPHHTKNYGEAELAYMAKIKVLTEFSEHIYNKNLKLKYRLNAVAREIKCLKRVKRILCRRVFERDQKALIGAHLEIPDSDTNTVVMDQIIGDVVNTATQSKNIPAPPIKKKKKAVQNVKLETPPENFNDSKDDEIHQHIISIIDNVANTSYNSSNGPTPSKKPRKQNLAALTSPTKDALIYSNGSGPINNLVVSTNNSLHPINSNSSFATRGGGTQLNTVKVEMMSSPTNVKPQTSTIVVQNKEFNNPMNLPIYVKREMWCPPEKANVVVSNAVTIPTVYTVQSTSNSPLTMLPNSTTTTIITLPNSTMGKVEASGQISNGQVSVAEANNYSQAKPTTMTATYSVGSPAINASAITTSVPTGASVPMTSASEASKSFYANKFNDNHGPSALTRENLKTLAQSRLNNSSQLAKQTENNHTDRAQQPSSISLTSSSKDLS